MKGDVTTMLITIAIIFIICGIGLNMKAKKIEKEQELKIIIHIGGFVFIILGVVLAYNILNGNIELPLW